MADALNELLEFKPAFHRGKDIVISGLQPHLQKREIPFLEEPGHLFIDEFGPHFSVEADFSMIVLSHKTTNLLSTGRIKIKNRIHKIDLVDLLLEPKKDLILDSREIEAPIPNREVLIVKAKIALEYTSSLGFKADDPSFMLPVPDEMRRRDVIKILQDGRVFGFEDFSSTSKCNTPHTTVVVAISG